MTRSRVRTWLVSGLAVLSACAGDCKGTGCGDGVMLTVHNASRLASVTEVELCLDNGQVQPCVSIVIPSGGLGAPLTLPSLGTWLDGRLTLTLRGAGGVDVSTASVDVSATGPESSCSGDCKTPTLDLFDGVLMFTEV